MTADAIAARLKSKLNASISSGMAYVVPPPPLPGVGTSGDVTFLLEDRQGIGEEFLASNSSRRPGKDRKLRASATSCLRPTFNTI